MTSQASETGQAEGGAAGARAGGPAVDVLWLCTGAVGRERFEERGTPRAELCVERHLWPATAKDMSEDYECAICLDTVQPDQVHARRFTSPTALSPLIVGGLYPEILSAAENGKQCHGVYSTPAVSTNKETSLRIMIGMIAYSLKRAC